MVVYIEKEEEKTEFPEKGLSHLKTVNSPMIVGELYFIISDARHEQ